MTPEEQAELEYYKKLALEADERDDASQKRIAELEAQVLAERNRVSPEMQMLRDQRAAAKIEGLRRAKDVMCEHIPGDHEVFDAIDAEIAALERGGKE